MNLREELLLAKAKFDAASVESSNLVRQLHTLQIQLHAVKSGDGDYDSSSIKEKLVSNPFSHFKILLSKFSALLML